MSRHFLLTPTVRIAEPAGIFSDQDYQAVAALFAREPRTPLHSLPKLAQKLGAGGLLLKDESRRMGMNAFKILGVRYAIERLRADGRLAPDATLACATDGNHGRAVARTAARLGLESHVFLPAHAVEQRVRAITAEGAHIHRCPGNYNDAVCQAALEADTHGWVLVSDTSWPGYEEIPKWIMCGYTHLMAESASQWTEPPDIVFVQAGVGGLACAVGTWFARQYGKWRPFLVLCQPARSAPIFESAFQGRPVRLEGSMPTVMDCLAAGEVSHVAWPVISSVYDAYVTVEEESAEEAVKLLGQHDVDAGHSGACGVAAMLQFCENTAFAGLREAASFSPESRLMAIISEGPLPG